MSEYSIPTLGISHEQWDELENFLFQTLEDKHGTGTSRYDISVMIYEFGKAFDLLALYGYLQFGKSRDLPAGEILTQIMHDLNGRKQDPKIFDPHTSGYREYAGLGVSG